MTPPSKPSTTPDTAPLSEADFTAMFDELRQWGSGQTVDERGALATITPETVRRALSTAQTGETISLARPIGRMSGPVRMGDSAEIKTSKPNAHKDVISLDYHTPAVSHIDAVCHIGYRDELFGGVASKDAFSLLGSNWAAVTAMQPVSANKSRTGTRSR